MTPLERLNASANLIHTNRPPCICPGGMMNMMVSEVLNESGCHWPDSHFDPQKMADLNLELRRKGGFENYGAPFCMTVEAEALGAKVYMGDDSVEPHVVESPFISAGEWGKISPINLRNSRIEVVLQAIEILKSHNDGIPVIGNVTGPISVAGMLVDMSTLLYEFRKNPEASHHFLKVITDNLVCFAQALVSAGADAICIAEPSGTGEILGAKHFEDYTIRYLNRILDAVIVPVKIVHICGRLRGVYTLLNMIHCNVFSFDAMVNVHQLKSNLSGKALMGNVSTHAIGVMSAQKVKNMTLFAAKQGIDILSPACGLPLFAPVANIIAMVEAAQSLGKGNHV